MMKYPSDCRNFHGQVHRGESGLRLEGCRGSNRMGYDEVNERGGDLRFDPHAGAHDDGRR